jgi:hypothetical protein
MEKGRGKCIKCGKEGNVKKEILVEHPSPIFENDCRFLGKFCVTFCDSCLAQGIARKRKGVLLFRSFWALIFLIGAGILFSFPLPDFPRAFWTAPLAVSALIGLYAARKIKSDRMLEADVLNDPLIFIGNKWGVREVVGGAGSYAGVQVHEIPMTDEAILGVVHPEIDEITGFTCDKCGRRENTKPGYRWPLVSCRIKYTQKLRGNVAHTLMEFSQPKAISIDVCRGCFHLRVSYKDFYTSMMNAAKKKAKPLYGETAFSEAVGVWTAAEYEKVIASSSPGAALKFERL